MVRILLPEHFGLVGMVVVFTGLIKVINDFGLSSTLIQKKQEELSNDHFSTVFWFSVFLSTISILLIALFVAPFLVWFYNEPRLYMITIALSLSVFISPLNIIHRVILTRELNFKKIAKIENMATIFGGICAVILALNGAGVWSIVLQSIFTTLIITPLMWRATKWVPTLGFKFSIIKELFGFSLYMLLDSIFFYIRSNVDYLIIGKLLGAQLLGLYSLAFLLTETFRGQLYSILNKVLFPVYSIIQDDIKMLHNYYLKTLKFNAITTLPLLMILISFTEPIILLLFGERWLPSSTPLKILALASMIVAVAGTPAEVLKAIGKPNLNFTISSLSTVFIVIPVLLIGIKLAGITGAAYAVLIHHVVTRLIYQYYMRKFIGVKEKELLQILLPGVLGSLAIHAFSLIVFRMNISINLPVLLILISISLGIYGAIVYKYIKPEIKMLIDYWQSKSSKKEGL